MISALTAKSLIQHIELLKSATFSQDRLKYRLRGQVAQKITSMVVATMRMCGAMKLQRS